eukprot:7714-Eustigmatos_ZCMA.PRE.1
MSADSAFFVGGDPVEGCVYLVIQHMRCMCVYFSWSDVPPCSPGAPIQTHRDGQGTDFSVFVSVATHAADSTAMEP